MRRGVELLCLLASLGLLHCERGSQEALPREPSVLASISPDSAGLGDPIDLTIEAVVPTGTVPTFPGEQDSIGAWKVLDAGPLRETGGDAESRRWVRHLTIAGFRLGWIGPDSLRITLFSAGGDSSSLACGAPSLYIGGEIDEETEVDPSRAHDIRDVVSTGPARWPWIVGGAVLLLVALLWVARWWRARKGPEQEVGAADGPTPQEEFEAAIARLLASGLLEAGRYREFYYGVSSAVRLVLERIYDLPLLESTSREVQILLSARMEQPEEGRLLEEWLQEGDLVKYARAERLQDEVMGYLERSKDLVGRWTKLLNERVGRPTAEPSVAAEIEGGSQ